MARYPERRPKIITSWEQIPLVMDLPLACIILGKSYDRMLKMSQQGKFPAFKCGVEWRVLKDDLIAYIEKQQKTGSIKENHL